MKILKRSTHQNGLHLRLLWGASEIRKAHALLQVLAQQFGQPEAADDIFYYLEKPGLLQRHPVLALVFEEHAAGKAQGIDGDLPIGAVLLFRYRLGAFPLGIYTSNDRSGRRTVIAPEDKRLRFAQAVVDLLAKRRAHVVMLSLRSDAEADLPAKQHKAGTRIVRRREIADYLQLESTFDATLARIGKRTRTHMRYYRKRALEQLACTFDPHLTIDTAGLLALNRKCTHPIPESVAAWRLRALTTFADPILVGLRDGKGELLGVIGGRRLGDQSEIFWQMNRKDLQGHSISLVARSFLIEDEIARGVRRLYLDGGSAHSLSNSFVRSSVTDLVMFRRSFFTFLLRRSARSLVPWDNELAHLLVDAVDPVSTSQPQEAPAHEGQLQDEPVLEYSQP